MLTLLGQVAANIIKEAKGGYLPEEAIQLRKQQLPEAAALATQKDSYRDGGQHTWHAWDTRLAWSGGTNWTPAQIKIASFR